VVYPLVNIWGSNNLLLWLSPSRSFLDVLTPTCRSSSGTRYQYACTSDFGECSSICIVKGLGARSATLSTSHCLAVARQSLNHHNGCDGCAGPVHTKCTCRAERLQTSHRGSCIAPDRNIGPSLAILRDFRGDSHQMAWHLRDGSGVSTLSCYHLPQYRRCMKGNMHVWFGLSV
jgi:hypothetical protein